MPTKETIPNLKDMLFIKLPVSKKTPRKKCSVIDAAETAKKGIFLDVPEFICRHIE